MSAVSGSSSIRRYATAALCALTVAVGAAGSTFAARAQAPASIMIVARKGLPDPSFAGSVVLVLNDLGPGPIGVIVNRPMPLPVSRLFPQFKRLAAAPDSVYFGGPVDFGSVWFLFRAAKPPAHAIEACAGVYMSSDPDLLHRLLGRRAPMAGLRIFVGHAGWAPGQLQAEVTRGDWKLERASPAAIFGGEPQRPWPAPKRPGNAI